VSVVDDNVEEVGSPPDRRREQGGWVWYDWANSVFPTSVITVFGSLYLTAIAADAAIADTATNGPNPCPADGDGGTNKLVDCQIDVFGLHFQAGSLWGYLLAAATVIQVLIVPLMARSPTGRRTRSGCSRSRRSAARPRRC